ncbi:hypothetical protein SDC9_146854 [bioreactor metagenome]|uniref:Uncharacterized protein n=1 Tax=bioreactor metagenome TaxID=1076179 RepID=A0A645EEF9_9ZZZZ
MRFDSDILQHFAFQTDSSLFVNANVAHHPSDLGQRGLRRPVGEGAAARLQQKIPEHFIGKQQQVAVASRKQDQVQLVIAAPPFTGQRNPALAVQRMVEFAEKEKFFAAHDSAPETVRCPLGSPK